MEEGTCIWWKNAYGFIGRGYFSNSSYEGQIYVHYKNIDRKGLKDPKYRELQAGDVVQFEEGTGFFNDGTQAIKVKVIHFADNDERHTVQEGNEQDEPMGRGRLEEVSKGESTEADPESEKSDEDGTGVQRGDETSDAHNNEQPDTSRRPRPKNKKDGQL